MTIGTETLFWIIVFALVILANLVNEYVQYRKRKSESWRHDYQPRPDDRDKLKQWNRIMRGDYR